jgi:hypothetical protein
MFEREPIYGEVLEIASPLSDQSGIELRREIVRSQQVTWSV